MTDITAMMYDDMQRYRGTMKPRRVRGQINADTFFWKNYLLRLLFGCFDFNNIPDGWDKDYMLTHLFMDGKICITDTAMGVLPLACGVSGVNVFNHPTTVIIANPVLGTLERTIEKDCALVKLEFSYGGVWRLLNRYADLLAQCDKAMSIGLMNASLLGGCIMFADNEAQAKTMRKLYDTLSDGEPVVFVKRSQVQKSDIYFAKGKENFLVDDVQVVQRKIIDQFLTTIGVNNANTDKRERMIRAEAESNDVEVQASVEHWLENVNEGLDVANRLYGLQLEFVRKRFEAENMDNMAQDEEHGEMKEGDTDA